MNKKIKYILTLGFILISDFAFANSIVTNAKLPWEGALLKIANSLTGPIPTIIAMIALSGASISMMAFEVGKGFRWLLSILIGFTILVSANNFLKYFIS